jgi:hypothetical protein
MRDVVLRFSEALAWARARGASWRFEREGDGCWLLLQIDGEAPIVVCGDHVTDWGWMFLRAVTQARDAIADTTPPCADDEVLSSDLSWS